METTTCSTLGESQTRTLTPAYAPDFVFDDSDSYGAGSGLKLLSSMAVGTDPAGAVCHGVLVVTMPSGKTLEIKTTFDSGSEVDAVSKTVATELKGMGCPWGEAGGGIAVADGSEVTPFGELRLMLTAEPKRREGQKAKANEFAIPRPLTFVTDAKIIDGLTSDLIIGWPTLKGTGLLAVVLGLEEY